MKKISILQEDTESCYISGRTDALEWHHIYGGRRWRKISEREGFKVRLNHFYHNEPKCRENCFIGSPHFNKEVRERLQAECQAKYEETHSHEEFMASMGRSFL